MPSIPDFSTNGTHQRSIWYVENELPQVIHGNCLHVLPRMEPDYFHSVVTDPPYGLKFMGKEWDHGIPGIRFWKEILRVAKPGAHLIAFGGTRTFHRLMCAIEDAGWEIRDTLMWVYGQGFPKSMDVGKAIDKMKGKKRKVIGIKPGHEEFANRTTKGHISFKDGMKGFDRPWMHNDDARARYHQQTAPATKEAKQWDGWGTALKPAWEPIILARKPFKGSVARNVLEHRTGGINVDECRVPTSEVIVAGHSAKSSWDRPWRTDEDRLKAWRQRKDENAAKATELGRYPANLVHDGSEEVMEEFAKYGSSKSPATCRGRGIKNPAWRGREERTDSTVKLQDFSCYGDNGTAARFFYCAKASKRERGEGNNHPTVKPLALMRWLVRLISPQDGIVLDPFAGSGTTLIGARMEGCHSIGIEKEESYVEICRKRLAQYDM